MYIIMEKTIKAELILENGIKFYGNAFGYIKETVGEVVFTTGMTGYQETLTDPSFARTDCNNDLSAHWIITVSTLKIWKAESLS